MEKEIISQLSQVKALTPMMEQYREIKEHHNDHILMYRLGDFYEMFFEDAVLASRELELTLTSRDCGDEKRAAMCGVPFFKADDYIGQLVDKGYKVAICEQVEDPALAKGLVRRDVIRIVTPGTVTDSAHLAENCNNYLCAVCFAEDAVSLAFADISTGAVFATTLENSKDLARMEAELGAYGPKEVLLNCKEAEAAPLCRFLTARLQAYVNAGREDLFDVDKARLALRATFGDRARGLVQPTAIGAVGAMLAYIRETQKVEPTFLKELNVYKSGQFMELDLSTQRNLELTQNMRDKKTKGTLLWVLDRTCTAMGGRELRCALRQPLYDISAISHRQTAVREFFEDFLFREEVKRYLSQILDIERLTARAVYGTANAKDLRALAQSLKPLPLIRSLLSKAQGAALARLYYEMDPLDDLARLLDMALVDEPPFTVREGGMIRDGFNADVDTYRSVQSNGTDWMREIERKEIEATGIRNLKVGYNRVFGYYIEVTKSQIEQVPDHYIRKQTLANCERYITQELKEMEAAVLGASDKLCALEYDIFCELRKAVADRSADLQRTAAQIAQLDLYRSLAEVAAENNYVCPEVDTSDVVDIREGRHPVVEKFMTDSYFVPNDTYLDVCDNRMMLITGPNMAGKSTYMRQVALIVLMAQIGSFVPAQSARVGMADRIFTRVGASDDLASGQSTFMLEMTEVANILRHATKHSLVIYDEVGRGTSTYDGMSIARAVVEYTASPKIGARSLFATHYHELTDMEGGCEGVVNYHIAAKKRGEDIVFLRKILRGATDDSYGIEVAKLAGVPSAVVKRARQVLAEIEQNEPAPKVRAAAPAAEAPMPDMLMQLQKTEAEEVADALRKADLNTLTPLEAMNLLFALKKKLST